MTPPESYLHTDPEPHMPPGRTRSLKPSRPEDRLAAARVGPHAVIHLRQALLHLHGDNITAAIFRRAGLAGYLKHNPDTMVTEAEAGRLFYETAQDLGSADAEQVFHMAGEATGAYIRANRIPRLARWLLRVLPAMIAVRLLLIAIRAHTWTFAGSAAARLRLGAQPALLLAGNRLATPAGCWHRSVLERLFRSLISDHLRMVYQRRKAENGTLQEMFTIVQGREGEHA